MTVQLLKQKSKTVFKILLLLNLLILSGCSKMGVVKTSLNPALKDPTFQQIFAEHQVIMVAPGSGVDPKRIEALNNLGLPIQTPPDILESAIPYHANTDQKRLSLLKAALFNRDPKTIVWTLRGGYGSSRLINKLQGLKKPKHPKYFIGFSDNTALHLFLSQEWGWKTIHGSGLNSLLQPEQDPQNFLKIAEIIHNQKPTEINDLEPLNAKAQKLLIKNAKPITAKLTGGNLTLLANSIGTPWQIQTKGKILFIEETSEKGYAVDRSLYHLKQAGLFKGVKAIVLGDFEEDTHPDQDNIRFALQRFAIETTVPVFKSQQFGHGITNYPLIYGSKGTIVCPNPNKETRFILLMNPFS